MPNQQLLAYINSELDKGVTREELVRSLLAAGWQIADINEALPALSVSTQTQSAPTVIPNASAPFQMKTSSQILLSLFVIFSPLMLLGILNVIVRSCSDDGPYSMVPNYTCNPVLGFDFSNLVSNLFVLNVILFPICIVLGMYLLFQSKSAVLKNRQVSGAEPVAPAVSALPKTVSRSRSMWTWILAIPAILIVVRIMLSFNFSDPVMLSMLLWWYELITLLALIASIPGMIKKVQILKANGPLIMSQVIKIVVKTVVSRMLICVPIAIAATIFFVVLLI